MSHTRPIQTRKMTISVFLQLSSQSDSRCQLLRLGLLYDAQKLQLSGT